LQGVDDDDIDALLEEQNAWDKKQKDGKQD